MIWGPILTKDRGRTCDNILPRVSHLIRGGLEIGSLTAGPILKRARTNYSQRNVLYA